ncbi:HNH endonuclease [Cryomorphaceae bacterium]|nr:HNH endonuclease [Cryomorphaceae bacterium]
MSNIVLQPCANSDSLAHFLKTVENRVPLKGFNSFFDSDLMEGLERIYPSGSAMFWGVTPKGNNPSKWRKISIGDKVLFAKNKFFFASATVVAKTRNQDAAKSFWGSLPDGATWEYMYFLEELERIRISYASFNKLVGYKENYVVQAFNVLAAERSNPFVEHYSLQSEVFSDEISEDEYRALIMKLESLETSEAEIISKRRREQSFLKKILFGKSTVSICACCSKEYPISFLVTAHIKKRSECSQEEKLDSNVVFPMCKFGCDELFEKGYLVVDDSGVFKAFYPSISSPELKSEIEALAGNECSYFKNETRRYFKWHYEFHRRKRNG